MLLSVFYFTRKIDLPVFVVNGEFSIGRKILSLDIKAEQ